MQNLSGRTDRRQFLTQTAVAGGVMLAGTAMSYARIIGSNDRISIGHIGVGNRGRGLDAMLAQLRDSKNAELIAVCDLWKQALEQAVAFSQNYYGKVPRATQHPEELLAMKDVDAVIISTPEHSHSLLLKMTVEAGKDAYCEKPMGNRLEDIKAARDAVLQRNVVVQIGTQHRSEPYQRAVRDLIRTGILGEVSKYEIVWNFNGPRWRGRPEVKRIHEQDTDWKAWLMDRPYRPFDPQVYFEYRLYRDFSSGIPDQWMSHAVDLVHFFMDESYPASVVSSGGVFAWHDGRENPDTFQALVTYPKGFLVSYSTSFGSHVPSFTRIMGKKASMINIGGEGSPRWQWIEDRPDQRGDRERDLEEKRLRHDVLLPGERDLPIPWMADEDLSHLTNWIDCIRTRKQPNATVQHGFSHSVVGIMAAQSYWSGKRLYWDATSESVLDHPT